MKIYGNLWKDLKFLEILWKIEGNSAEMIRKVYEILYKFAKPIEQQIL